ncbi:MAG: hypothetical protein WB683_01820, partial [Candidatus Sulfotelmatobacter sp.]
MKRPVKAGSVVPSFAKTGKAGAASFADVRARNIEDGPAPSADSSTFHGTGRRFFLYVFVVKFDLALPDYFIDDCVQIAFANSLLEPCDEQGNVDEFFDAGHVAVNYSSHGILLGRFCSDVGGQSGDTILGFDNECDGESLNLVDVQEILPNVSGLSHLKKPSERTHDKIDSTIVCVRAPCFVQS